MKIKVVVTILLVSSLAAAYFWLGKKDVKPEFVKSVISKGDINYQVLTTGTLNALEIVEIGSQTSGKITELYVDYNSIVKKGMLLAKLDPLTQKQTVFEAKAQFDKNNAQLEDLLLKLKKYKELYGKNISSEEEYLAAKVAVEIAKSTLDQSRSQLERAQINLSYTEIYAPSGGVVIDRKVNVGQTVNAGLSAPTLFTIAKDLSKMQLEALVDESDIGKIGVNQEVSFTVDAYSSEDFVGKVSSVRLSPISVSNVVNYTVVILVDNPKLKLLPGMTANVQIKIASEEDVYRVSNQALRFQPPKELVDSVKVALLDEKIKAERKAMREKHRSERKGDKEGFNQVDRVGSSKDSKGDFFVKEADLKQLAETRSGRLWIYNKESKKLEPISVRTGITDGRFTQIKGENVNISDSVIVGLNSTNETPNKTNNPLAGRAPARIH